MSTYDKRLDALEKEVPVMKQDIIYKLDDTNSAVTMIRGIVEDQGRDIKFRIGQMKNIDHHLGGVDHHLSGTEHYLRGFEIQSEGLNQEVRTIKEQQDLRGQDIKDIKSRLDGLDKKFDQMLSLFSTHKPESQQES